MNDPGFDEGLAGIDEDIENTIERDGGEGQGPGKEGKASFLKTKTDISNDTILPSHYWLMSTAAPLTAATLGPVANVISICALVFPWRVYVPPGTTAEYGTRVPDPKWALAINAVSLASGIASNIVLLLNLAKRISPNVAQPVTITLWYFAAILLLILVCIFDTHLRLAPQSEHAWSQAYYYAIIALSLYFFISTLLVLNYGGALAGKYKRHFNLTIAQRTMMLQTMSLMMWMCLGAGVFAKIEGWSFLDAIFWADVTLLTVGLGDITPSTSAGRALLWPYAAIGIVTLGLVVGSIRGLVLERGKRKVERRMLEKERLKIMDEMEGASEKDKSDVDSLAKVALESNKEKDHFEVMRKIQEKADKRRKWMSLIISVSCFLTLWMLGALAFFKAEYLQDWSYFESLYFAFTSLLTIGYGDFVPKSDAGKAFFVIWSLIAIPALTILISNMGDTLIAGVKDFTLKIGEWTILPEEKGLKHKLLEKTGSTKNWIKRTSKDAERIENDEEKAQDFGNDGDDDNDNHKNSKDRDANPDADAGAHKDLQETAEQLLEEETKEDLASTSSRSMTSQKARINLHHKLALSVQKLIADLASNPPKRYTFEEWKEYLQLINMPNPSEQNWDNERRKSNISAKDVKEKSKTDWLGEDSPLMASESETEWLVKRLCVRLEECLREVNDGEDRREQDGKKNRKRHDDRRKKEYGNSNDESATRKQQGDLQL